MQVYDDEVRKLTRRDIVRVMKSHRARPAGAGHFKHAVGAPAAASLFAIFCSTLARYISRNMSSALLLAAPSVLIAIGIPAAASLSSGAIPEASFAFEPGFVTAQASCARKAQCPHRSSTRSESRRRRMRTCLCCPEAAAGAPALYAAHLTSLSVSQRCMKQGSLYFSAKEAMYFMRSMPVVYSAWMPSQ